MSQKAKAKVHRLQGLLVEEVSIVDRPANQRPFLLVKNEGDVNDDKGTEIEMDADGKLVTPAAPTPPTPPTPEGIDAVFKATGEGFAKLEKSLSIPMEMRSEVFRSLGDAMRRLNTVMASADVAQVDHEGTKTSSLLPVLASELGEVAKTISAMAKKMSGAAGGVKKSDDDKPDDTNDEIEAKLQSLVEDVEKRGAKMSKTRLSRFKDALTTLASILSELDSGDAPKKTEKAEDPAALAQLAEKITQLTEIVQKQAGELRRVRASTPASNTIPIEKASAKEPEEEKVVWPLDMNRA